MVREGPKKTWQIGKELPEQNEEVTTIIPWSRKELARQKDQCADHLMCLTTYPLLD